MQTNESSRMRPLLIFLLLSLFAPSISLPAPIFLNLADYQESDEVIMARGPGMVITERECLAFITGIEAPITQIFDLWQTFPAEKQEELRNLLIIQAQARLLAAKWDSPDSEGFAQRAARMFAGPTAALVWSRRVLTDDIIIFPEDIHHHYLTNLPSYSEPGSRTVRLARIRLDAELETSEAITQARANAERLRQQAVESGGLKPLLQRYAGLSSGRPDPLVVRSGMERPLDPLLAEAILTLSPSQISAPIQTDDGFYLAELLAINSPEPMPINSVEQEIKEKLRETFLPIQFDYQVLEVVLDAFPINHGIYYDFIDDETKIVRVRDFYLTRGEFTRIFPEFIDSIPLTDRRPILFKLANIVTYEAAAQQMERKGWADDPLFQTALEVGETLFKSGDYVRSRFPEIQPTVAEIQAFLEENRDELAPDEAKVVWEFKADPLDTSSLSAGASAQEIRAGSTLRDLVSKARRIFEERSAIAGTPAVLRPNLLMNRIIAEEDDEIEISFQPAGTYTKTTAEAVFSIPYEDLELGGFTEPRRTADGSFVSYYTSEITEPPVIPEEVLMALAERRFKEEMVMGPVLDQVENWVENGELVFHERLQSDQP